MDFKQKYLKYKQKYLVIKNQTGGNRCITSYPGEYAILVGASGLLGRTLDRVVDRLTLEELNDLITLLTNLNYDNVRKTINNISIRSMLRACSEDQNAGSPDIANISEVQKSLILLLRNPNNISIDSLNAQRILLGPGLGPGLDPGPQVRGPGPGPPIYVGPPARELNLRPNNNDRIQVSPAGAAIAELIYHNYFSNLDVAIDSGDEPSFFNGYRLPSENYLSDIRAGRYDNLEIVEARLWVTPQRPMTVERYTQIFEALSVRAEIQRSLLQFRLFENARIPYFTNVTLITFLEHLRRYNNLRYITLDNLVINNELAIQINRIFRGCDSLRSLILNNCNITDETSRSLLEDLGLIRLSINGSAITNLNMLSGCVRLQELTISSSNNLRDIRGLVNCPGLNFLNLSNNRLNDSAIFVGVLPGLINLRQLFLDVNGLDRASINRIWESVPKGCVFDIYRSYLDIPGKLARFFGPIGNFLGDMEVINA